MEATNDITLNKSATRQQSGAKFNSEDKLALGQMKYAQGLGASLRYANELRAVQQVGRLPFLKSSKLHEDVLRGNLGPGNGLKEVFGDSEETCVSRLAYL